MKKAIVTSAQNIFYDGKQVDDKDLTVEQEYNSIRINSTIQNTIGTGVIQDYLLDRVIYSGSTGDCTIAQPGLTSDSVNGVQIQASLSGSKANGSQKVKLLLIGLDFNLNLIYDSIYLTTEEVVVTKNHYTSILLAYVNDLFDTGAGFSLNLGGTLTIKESKSCELSKELIVDSNSNPNVFFRDLYIRGDLASSFTNYLNAILIDYDISQLNIQYSSENFSVVQKLERADLVKQMGQKFIAKSNNIQKISFLISVENTDDPFDLVWDGELNVSIYPLQSSVSCITDIVPENKIDYPPTSTPLAQLSLNYYSLLAKGITLDGTPQPVDFVFSNTQVSNGKTIKVGEAYIIVVKRTGTNTKVNLLFSSSENTDINKQLSIFSGTSGWVNINTQSLTFNIYSDNAKLTSGQYYSFGEGISIDKNKFDPITGTTKDWCIDNLNFATNQVYKGILETSIEKIDIEENPRTGDSVFSKKHIIPNAKLLSPTEYSALRNSSQELENEILTVGAIKDKNRKYENADTFTLKISSWGAVNNRLFIKVITDILDPNFDQSVIDFKSMCLNNDIKFSKMNTSSNIDFKLVDTKIHDVRIGNYKYSTPDYNDLNEFYVYKDLNFNVAPGEPGPTISLNPIAPHQITYNPSHDFLCKKTTSTNFSVGCIPTDSDLIPLDLAPRTCDITPTSDGETFNITNMAGGSGDFDDILSTNTNPYLFITTGDTEIIGRYLILSATANSAVVRKPFLEKNYIKALSFDIDGDQIISSNDGYLLNIYLNKTPYSPYVSSYPVVDPYQYINTSYEVLELTFENLLDRSDDFYSGFFRANNIHSRRRLYTDSIFKNYSSPINVLFTRQLVWKEEDVICYTSPRLVESVFSDFEITNLDKDPNSYQDVLDFEKNINNYYNPGNYLLDGNILNPDKTYHKLDFEVSDIILEIPEGLDGYQKTLNVFDYFVYENINGLTSKGFTALKFSDQTFVQSTALTNDQVRFSVAIQSFTPQLDGEYLGNPAIIVDGRMGLAISDLGVLSLNFTNLYNDPAYVSGNTKIKISVFLKKAGFTNKTVLVNSIQVSNLLS